MRRFSFAAGPCPLPSQVKQQIAEDALDWKGTGVSALELPFTSGEFVEIITAAEEGLRLLLGIPRSYKVLFIQGGATAQFALLPMNLVGATAHCDYVKSGYWSRRAIEEADASCDVHVIARGTSTELPKPHAWRHNPEAAYCHFTSNESADGLQYHSFPKAGHAPLVADMTGDFLTRPVPVERFGLIYAGAQKSLVAAGLSIVIVREDMLGRGCRGIPAPFDLARQAATGSMVNTPPTFAVLVAARMIGWIIENGGLEAAAKRSRERSARLYDAIDRSGFYVCAASRGDRSSVNVCFRLPEERLDEAFLREADAAGLSHLRGHLRVGGLRASLYNSTPDEAVDALVGFMADFQKRNG